MRGTVRKYREKVTLNPFPLRHLYLCVSVYLTVSHLPQASICLGKDDCDLFYLGKGIRILTADVQRGRKNIWDSDFAY